MMIGLSRRQAALGGFAWGSIAGIALVALMYLAALLLGLRPLPQALNQPLLSLMPGFVFGFLIDTLQHAGKVVEELGLIIAMIVALGVVGAASAVAGLRWKSRYLPLAFAGAGWVLVVAVLLPVSGVGFLGLADGPVTPIIWAALFAVYGVVLQMGFEPSSTPGADPGRRRVLSAMPVTIGAVGLGVLGVRLGPGWYRAIFDPPEAGLVGTPEITPVQDFYVVSKNFNDPVVDGRTWRLNVGGLVDHPMTLSAGRPPGTRQRRPVRDVRVRQQQRRGRAHEHRSVHRSPAERPRREGEPPVGRIVGRVHREGRVHGEPAVEPGRQRAGDHGRVRPRRLSPADPPWLPSPHRAPRPLRNEEPEVAGPDRPRDTRSGGLLGEPGLGPQRGRQDHRPDRPAARRRHREAGPDHVAGRRVRRDARREQGGVHDRRQDLDPGHLQRTALALHVGPVASHLDAESPRAPIG